MIELRPVILAVVLVVIGGAVGFLFGPSVTDTLLRWGYIESVIRCIRAPCPIEASPATARAVTAMCVLAGAMAGAVLAVGTGVAHRLVRRGGSVGSRP